MSVEKINFTAIKNAYKENFQQFLSLSITEQEEDQRTCLDAIKSQSRSFQLNPKTFYHSFQEENTPSDWEFKLFDFSSTNSRKQYCHQCRSLKRADQLFFCSNAKHQTFHPFFHKKKQKEYVQNILKQLSSNPPSKGPFPENQTTYCGKVFCVSCIHKSISEKKLSAKPSMQHLCSNPIHASFPSTPWFCLSCMGQCSCQACLRVKKKKTS